MKNRKMIATLLVFALLLLASIGGMNVFAEEGADDALEATDTVAQVVSGCDLKLEDLIQAAVKQYGFSMLVPNANVITIDSDASVFEASDYTRSYFMEQGCMLYCFTDNENYCAVSAFVTDQDSIYNYYGDYAKLNDTQKAELVKAAVTDSATQAEFVKINGRDFLQVTMSDDDVSTGNSYTQYQFTTVIGSQKYVIYIQTANANESDLAVVNEMIKSIKLNGMGLQMNSLDIVLIVVSALLVVAVAIVYFFFYRATRFVKAGINDFARIGFDLPEKTIDEDDIYDDEDEDEVDEADEDASDDDEKIIKD